jgi:hypothetical protein
MKRISYSKQANYTATLCSAEYDDGTVSRSSVLAAVLAASATLTFAARAADPVITSTAATTSHAADGALLEWDGLKAVTEGLQMAAANDGQALFVAVRASTPQMRLSLSGGLVLWFDTSGGHKETFGLQLPRPGEFDPASVSSGMGMGRLTPTTTDQIDVLGPGKLARKLVDLEPSFGVGVGVGGEDGGVVFELRVPLAKSTSQPIAIGTSAGRAVSVGLETPLKRKGPREPLEPIIWPDPYSYYYRRPLPPTAPLTNAADRPPPEMKPKTVSEWVTVKLTP